jgi:HAD superfamily hydrolase (TIGR01509 family)
VRPFPKVRELFKELLRRGVRIALASSAKKDELETYKKLVHIEDLVQAETSADDARRSKPHPDIFQAALNRLGKDIELARTFVVGDSPWDAIAAHRLGVRTIGVLCGGFPEQDLRQAGCIAIYRDPADLLQHLDQSPLA